jgi:hypothetical protein
LVVYIGRKNDEPNGRKSGLERQLPEEREAVGFFSGRTAETPAPEDALAPRLQMPSEGRQHFLLEKLEDALVSVEARDRDPTRGVQLCPFFGMVLQVCPIVGERWKTQRVKPSLDAPVDLPPHLAIAGPAELESRQTPLQELNAFCVLHRFDGDRIYPDPLMYAPS